MRSGELGFVREWLVAAVATKRLPTFAPGA
jgi:hypothetical protein